MSAEEPPVTKTATHVPKADATARASSPDEALAQIRESLRDLKFGSVNIIVQDGVIIQIDRTEKRRVRGK